MGKIIDVTDLNFDQHILAAPVPALVDFSAVWCPPCRAIAPHVTALADKLEGRLRVGHCDVDGSPRLAERFEVRSLPTLLLFVGGRVVGQLVGAAPRARIEALVRTGAMI